MKRLLEIIAAIYHCNVWNLRRKDNMNTKEIRSKLEELDTVHRIALHSIGEDLLVRAERLKDSGALTEIECKKFLQVVHRLRIAIRFGAADLLYLRRVILELSKVLTFWDF